MAELLPLFVNLADRSVVLVGAGGIAAGKLRQLRAAGARVRVVALEIGDEVAEIARSGHADGDGTAVHVIQRAFVPEDLDDAWLVVAAATPSVNRQVAEAAGARRMFVNAVDDPPNATAYLSGVVRRDGVTLAISTSGDAPALTALLREGLDRLLPRDLGAWMARARAERVVWCRESVPMRERKPRLLRALNDLYRATAECTDPAEEVHSAVSARAPHAADANVPWLNSPEDSWL